MSFFCLFWVPLFYLFRRSVSSGEAVAGGVWALILGSLTAVFQFFLGSLVKPGGFGMSRWLSGFVDIVSLPVLLPLLVYLFFIIFRVFSGGWDFTNFALIWFIPSAAVRALSWSSQNDPILLVLVPLLWTAVAVDIPFFISLIIRFSRWYVIVPAGLCILALPIAAATVYWAFFSQRSLMACLILLGVLLPMVISLTLAFVRGD